MGSGLAGERCRLPVVPRIVMVRSEAVPAEAARRPNDRLEPRVTDAALCTNVGYGSVSQTVLAAYVWKK